MLLSRIVQNKISGQISLICPEKPSDYKDERGKRHEKPPLPRTKSKWDKPMVLSHESEVFPVQRNSAALLKSANDDSLQVRLQALAQEAVSIVMEADPAHCKELLGLFVADLFSQVAEQERTEERRQRQAEGIAAAKARGVRFGKKMKPLPDNFEEVRHAWRNNELTIKEAAASCGMAKNTFYKAV